MGSMLFAQNRIVNYTPALDHSESSMRPKNVPVSEARTPSTGSTTPIGGTFSDMITTVKIGEASNSYSTLAAECNPLTYVPGIGTNGGSLAFVHRRNIANCGGQTIDNGRLTYSISTDFGSSWNVGNGITSTATNPPPVNHCFGVVEITPAYNVPVRYPMGVLFSGTGGTSVSDLVLSTTGSLINNGQWDGNHHATVLDPAGAINQTQDEYPNQGVGHTISGGLVERVPGEFWYATNETQGTNNDPGPGRVFIYKGTYNTTTQKTDWTLNTTLTPDNFLLDGINAQLSTPNMGFSPDGTIGYVTWLGDLNGGQDSVLSPIVSESSDGGQTWSDPIEISLESFPEIADSLQTLLVIDSVSPSQIDTIPFATGVATTAFDVDIAVDANGNPHIFTTVGSAETVNTPVSGYTIFGGIHLMNLSFTKDQFGDWNAIYISTQNTFRGWFGDLSAQGSQQIAQDIHNQVSRSADGTKIFFGWVDTDTTANGWAPIPSFPGGNNMTNFSPDLRLRAYDVSTNLLTPVDVITEGDLNWGGLVLLPKFTPLAHDQGNGSFTIPTVIANIDGGSALQTTSYHYITDINVDITTASEPPIFFYNCKENPFANNINQITPDCGTSNGELTVTTGGGIGPYTLAWTSGDTSATLSNLSAGLYEIVVTDSKECTDTLSITLNNANAPTLSIDPSSVSDISCFGANDGSATVTVSGGAGSETYTWSNNETSATAMSLPPGVNTIEVTDANGCKSFESVSINEPAAIDINISSVGIDCAGNGNGSVSAIAVGGTGTLTYDWGTAGTGPSIDNLAGGIYQVVVTDANSCVDSAQIVVDEPDPISVTGSSSPNSGTLQAPNGTASASASGGTSPYVIDWTLIGSVDTAFNAPFIFGLCEGDYEAIVIDFNGCVTRDTITVGVAGLGCSDNIEDELAAGITTFQLFPNPAHDLAQLRLELDRPEAVNIKLTNLHGQVMESVQLAPNQQLVHNLDVSRFAAGIYFVEVETSRGRATQRLMIE